MLPVHRQSAYLFGRDRRVADIPVDHPSCSKQHAVLQYRLSEYGRPDGSVGRRVRPYIIDLASANGTFINNQPIDGLASAREKARKPKRRWCLYGFKGDEALPMLPVHRQSAYLLGRDRRVADIPVAIP
ncbi:hypothetical protein ACOMHN_020737 [Nucella lapillus]